MRDFEHATILSPSFHGLRKERLAQWPFICVQNTTKNALQIMSLVAYASETNNQDGTRAMIGRGSRLHESM